MTLEVIKKIYRKKSEEREKMRGQLIEDVYGALEELSKEVSFKEAYIFGSITKPYRFWETSDVDIAFKGLDREKIFFTISFLNRLLGRDVNVVPIEGVHFKDKILKEGIRWMKD